MPKEVLVYTALYDYPAELFINALEENKYEDIRVRINSDGGSPEAAFGMIAKMQEHKGKVDIDIDGRARSMAAFFPLYATGKVKALDTTEFLFHRAAYPQWAESNPAIMTEARKASLTKANADLRAAFEAKVDVPKFEAIAKKSVSDLFSLDSRIDVVLTAMQAKEIGLIDEIVSITPQMKAEIDATTVRLAAEYNGVKQEAAQPQPKQTTEILKKHKMTLIELKAQHPELYAEVVKIGETQERDRVGALMAFADVDLDVVKTAIEDGTNLTQKMSAEFTRKAISKGALGELAANAAPKVEPGDAPTTVEPKVSAEYAAWEAEVDANLGLKK